MGRKGDQSFSGGTYRPPEPSERAEQTPTGTVVPPPLPPRLGTIPSSPSQDRHSEAPPPYVEATETFYSQPLESSWSSQDPRSSSTQSLVPHQSTEANRKRTLLLVYVHGFLGKETSFQSFPAHVHNLVSAKLAESHAVHTKIYPRYKSRKHIEVAVNALSDWLSPNENAETDIILLGHSMGGFLSADVALLENHPILGTINFDTPFLGLHPGIIASGIGSLFRPTPEPPARKFAESGSDSQAVSRTASNNAVLTSASSPRLGSDASCTSTQTRIEDNSGPKVSSQTSSSLDLPVTDPNYDPPFPNDVRLAERSGIANAIHFIGKHSDHLTRATQSYVKSHIEFGAAVTQHGALNSRYGKIRALENGRDNRVRFVNYYTASTGRPKKPIDSESVNPMKTMTGDLENDGTTLADDVQQVNLEASRIPSQGSRPQVSAENPHDDPLPEDLTVSTNEDSLHTADSHTNAEDAMSHVSPSVYYSDSGSATNSQTGNEPKDHDEPARCSTTSEADPSPAPPTHEMPNLPPIPSAPEEPRPCAPFSYPDKDTRKLAEKDHTRLVKSYKEALKNRDKAILDRRKFLEKKEKEAAKQRIKQEKDRLKLENDSMEKGERDRAKTEQEELKKQEKEKAKAEKQQEKDRAKAEKEAAKESKAAAKAASSDEKPKKDRKFCMLPSKVNGQIDPCWVRTFMPDVDEVGAHCGLFTVDGDRYERFVTEVAGRIDSWVEESRV